MNIKFQDVSFSYTEKESGKADVIKNISFEINQGEMVAILGHNGSGKSTIAKLIVGLLSPQKGSIYLDEFEATKEDVSEDELDFSVKDKVTSVSFSDVMKKVSKETINRFKNNK